MAFAGGRFGDGDEQAAILVVTGEGDRLAFLLF
jgi:hypothetical protein